MTNRYGALRFIFNVTQEFFLKVLKTLKNQIVERIFIKALRMLLSCRADVLVAQIVPSTTSSGLIANGNAC